MAFKPFIQGLLRVVTADLAKCVCLRCSISDGRCVTCVLSRHARPVRPDERQMSEIRRQRGRPDLRLTRSRIVEQTPQFIGMTKGMNRGFQFMCQKINSTDAGRAFGNGKIPVQRRARSPLHHKKPPGITDAQIPFWMRRRSKLSIRAVVFPFCVWLPEAQQKTPASNCAAPVPASGRFSTCSISS